MVLTLTKENEANQKPMERTGLIIFAAVLAWCVVVFGAYVRLQNAGLACPDWPGCYGKLTAPLEAQQNLVAQLVSPDRSVESTKAWIEMIHRYLAGSLGILIMVIFVRNLKQRRHVRLSSVLLLLVLVQATLGLFTVIGGLKPIVVTSHLLGGMATAATLTWLVLKTRLPRTSTTDESSRRLRFAAGAALMVLSVQIMSGGWTSSNNAALVCGEFPKCQGQWLPFMNFSLAFDVARKTNVGSNNADDIAALTAIHWVHRIGALLTAAFMTGLIIAIVKHKRLYRLAYVLLSLLVLQIGLGIANVLLGRPLVTGVLHNAVAAFLLLSIVITNARLWSREATL